MNLFKQIQFVKAQIVDTQRLLELVNGHPLMSISYKAKLQQLEKELSELPKNEIEPKVKLMFSGDAVIGSEGIKSSFISKIITPFIEMINTQVALVRYGSRSKQKNSKKNLNTELYLTALPIGSFGIELSQLENINLFDNQEVTTAMKETITLIANTSIDDKTFESTIENIPKKSLSNLKKFLKVVIDEKSVLKMECNELGFEITTDKVFEAYNRVADSKDIEEESFINGVFRGLLLDSGKFEFQIDEGKKLSGFISENLNEEDLINYNKTYLNRSCELHLKVHKTTYKTGNKSTEYELLEIK